MARRGRQDPAGAVADLEDDLLLRMRQKRRQRLGPLPHDAAVIHQAALLHDFAELLLWLRAPALALQIAQIQADQPNLRSCAVQLLNAELADVQHALMLAWRLPALLVQITDEHPAQATAQVHNVQLAIRVARHTAHGWDNPALPDDVRDIAQLLHMSPEHTLQLLQQIDAD